MTEDFKLKGPLYRDRDMPAMNARVWALWPGAVRHGSYGHWHWRAGEMIVAEAWFHRRTPLTGKWHLRVKEKRDGDPRPSAPD